MKWKNTIGTTVCAVAVSLAAGCNGLNRTPEVKDLDWALAKANASAQEWNADARLVGILAVWVDEQGLLHEQTDNPGWGFQYVNAAGDQQIGVSVEADGNTERSAATTLGTPITDTLVGYTQADIEAYITVGLAALHQAEVEADVPSTAHIDDTQILDIVVIIGFNEQDGSEDASLFIHIEDDQATNWDEIDWMTLFNEADAHVFIDTATLAVETTSWQMTLRRATRIARATAGPDALLTGIMAVWMDADGTLGETEDNPGWGFRFTYPDGQRIGITVQPDGTVLEEAAPAIDEPETQEISEHTDHELQNYAAAALSALNDHPERAALGNEFDFFVVVGFSLADGTEDALVIFEVEEDQAVDWATLDFVELMMNAPAWVSLNTTTLEVEAASWEQ